MTQENAEFANLLQAKTQLFQLECKLAGMKAANQAAKFNGDNVTHSEEEFKLLAEESFSVENTIWATNRI